MAAFTLIAWGMTLTSCRDHTPEPNPAEIGVSDTHLEIGSEGRYYLLEVDKSQDQTISVDTDVDWIEIDTDYVPDSGNLEIRVTPNEDSRSRDGKIHLRDITGETETIVSVH